MPTSSYEPVSSLHEAATIDGVGDLPPSSRPSGSPSTGASPWQLQPAPSYGSYPSSAGELRDLVQRRLATVLALGAAIWATVWLVGLTSIDPFFRREIVGIGGQSLALMTTVVWAAIAVGLRVRRDVPLGVLRGLELVALIVYVTANLGFRWQLYRHGLSQPLTAAGGTNLFLCAAALYNGFGWLGVIIGWGLVIPATCRRTMAVVLALVACPLLHDAALLATQFHHAAALAYPLVITGQMLTTAVVLALFGSFRLSAMQQEVAAARQEAQAARTLGPYTLKRRIGVGGMGEVYLAVHQLLKRPCAIKLIRPERADDPHTLSRFDREVQATAALKHPNTVAIFDYGRTADNTFYYVMEYLDGLGLDAVVRRYGPLPPERVAHLLRQLCGALHEAHEAGLVHRDIKPSNVLICRYGGMFDVVKLVDFGLVRHTAADVAESQQTNINALVGTPDYMSPEQADGDRLDARSDLYSLGATAFFLLTGKPPFSGKNAIDTLFAHRAQPIPAMLEFGVVVPPELETIIRRCLAKSPADRFGSTDALANALHKFAPAESWTMEQARAWWQQVPPHMDE